MGHKGDAVVTKWYGLRKPDGGAYETVFPTKQLLIEWFELERHDHRRIARVPSPDDATIKFWERRMERTKQ